MQTRSPEELVREVLDSGYPERILAMADELNHLGVSCPPSSITDLTHIYWHTHTARYGWKDLFPAISLMGIDDGMDKPLRSGLPPVVVQTRGPGSYCGSG